MRSMLSGVSGLRAHQTRMDVIGNNVANVNTVGFKAGRVTFQELFSQTIKGAVAPDSASGRGGTNPMQVGLGTSVGSIDTIMTRGSLQTTDNPFDLSIEGEGFFICKGSNSDTFMFTRAGNFGRDELGNLVTGGGLNVYGWQEYTQQPDGTYKFNTEADIVPLNILNKRMIQAKATSNVAIAGNLNASEPPLTYSLNATNYKDEAQFSMPLTVYDSLGNKYEITVYFAKRTVSGGANPVTTWSYYIPDNPDTNNPPVFTVSGNTGTIDFDSKGQFISTSSSIPDLIINPGNDVGSEPITITLDFSNITSYSAASSVKPTNIDGYPTGSLVTFNIGSDGVIMGIYSNGQQQPLGMIALASFENPAGLQKVGNNLYIVTPNSGNFEKGVKPGSEGVGTLCPGTLEMSNVDLSQEFTNMIITQRGFQANSRIITTSDEMLQELVNLKR